MLDCYLPALGFGRCKEKSDPDNGFYALEELIRIFHTALFIPYKNNKKIQHMEKQTIQKYQLGSRAIQGGLGKGAGQALSPRGSGGGKEHRWVRAQQV